MIVIVEIIAGRLMRGALGCQYFTIGRNEQGIPRGITGFHLETQSMGSNEY
jgi:hypothetical protein